MFGPNKPLDYVNLKSPYAWWEGFLSEEEVKKIKNLKKIQKFSEGSILEETDNNPLEQVRKSRVCFFHNDSKKTQWLFNTVNAKVNQTNQDFFRFDLFEAHSFQYTLYDREGDFYRWHWDVFTGANVVEYQRKLSVVIQLSDPSEYEGGDLILYVAGSEVTLPKSKGAALFFPSWINHAVTPVTSGSRETLVFWFKGPNWR